MWTALNTRNAVIPPARFTQVDLLRGLSAVAVLFVHYRMFYPEGNDPRALFEPEHLPWFNVLWPLYGHGNLAVQFFWALSGFVFMATYRGQERTISASRFFVWRFSRLYPLHFATLIYLAALQWVSWRKTGSFSVVAVNDAFHFILQLFFASNWGLQTADSFNAPVWSVSVEVLIYLVFFIFMRLGRTGPVAFGVVVATWAGLAWGITNPIATCGLLFFSGMILFRLCLWFGRFGRLVAIPLALLGFAATVMLAVMAGPAHADEVVMFLCLPATLFLFATIDLFSRPVPNRFRWIGDITYAVYLIHLPVIVTITLLGRYTGTDYAHFDRPPLLIIYLVGVIAAGIFVHRRFELPAQNAIRSRWRRWEAARRQAGEKAPLASSSR